MTYLIITLYIMMQQNNTESLQIALYHILVTTLLQLSIKSLVILEGIVYI
jgi:hypothetical protein